MRTLKKKYMKNKTVKLRPIVRIKKKPKIGRWCKYYAGRLPYPIECSGNKNMPISRIFKDKKITVLRNRSDCVHCKRSPEFLEWKRGDWDKIKEAISNGENLIDMDHPV